MNINGNPVQDEMRDAVEAIVKLHTAEAFIDCRGERTPCRLLTAESTCKASRPTLAGHYHTGSYDPETKALYAYDNGGIRVIYQLPADSLCCERDPRPEESLLRVSVTSHELSKLIGDSNKGTHTHLVTLP